MILSPVFRQRFFDSNNNPLAGGKLYSYAAGTTTPQATYTDQGGLTPNTNPVVLDASGYVDVWLDPTLAYKLILKDSSDVQQWSVDQVSGSGSTGIGKWVATSNYSHGDIVEDSSGVGILYVSIQDNNTGNALSNVAYWRVLGGNLRTVTANTTLLVTDELVRSNSTSGSLTHTLPACSATPIGKRIMIKDVGTGGNTTTVKGAGTDNVDGANTYAAALSSLSSVTVENNGSSWDVIQGAQVPDGSIVTSKLAASAVTTAKIADANVTNAKMAANSVDNSQLVASSVTIDKQGAIVTAGNHFSQTIPSTSGTINCSTFTLSATKTDRPLLVMVTTNGAGNGAVVPAGATMNFTILRDGSVVIALWSAASTDGATFPVCMTFPDYVSVGAHSYTLQASVTTGTGSVSGVLAAMQI